MTRSALRRLSLLEVVIAAALLMIALTLVSEVALSSTSQLRAAQATTQVVVEGERGLELVRSELRNSGLEASGGSLRVESSGLQDGSPLDTIRYRTLVEPLAGDPFQPAWSELRVLRFEAGDDPLGDGVDGDGDFRVDEGQLVLYRDPPSAANQIAVIGRDISRFEVTLHPASAEGLARLELRLETDAPLLGQAGDPVERARLSAGGGTRRQHVARASVLLRNE